jgi:hypothetical protein
MGIGSGSYVLVGYAAFGDEVVCVREEYVQASTVV